MKNNYDVKTAFVFAAYDAEAHMSNTLSGGLFETRDVAWIIRSGSQRLPRHYAIGYVLHDSASNDTGMPVAVSGFAPDLPDDVANAMRDETKNLLFTHRYGMSSEQIYDTVVG
jgi:hypothetical protein